MKLIVVHVIIKITLKNEKQGEILKVKKFFRSLVAMMLVCLMAISFTSCGISKNPEKVKEKLEKKDYSVILNTLDLGDLSKCEATLTASNGDESIQIFWYKEAEDAREAYEEYKEAYEKAKDEIKDMDDGEAKDKAEETLKNTGYGKSGKVVWFGTKKAIRAAK